MHKSIEQELNAISFTGEYGQAVVDAINRVGLGFAESQYFADFAKCMDSIYGPAEGRKVHAIFKFDPDPRKRRIMLNADIADDSNNILIVIEHLSHEGIHALQAIERPELFDDASPDAGKNECILEREAVVGSLDITLRSALYMAACTPGDLANSLSELPEIQALKRYSPMWGLAINMMINKFSSGLSLAEAFAFMNETHGTTFDKSYSALRKPALEASGDASRNPELPQQKPIAFVGYSRLKDGP